MAQPILATLYYRVYDLSNTLVIDGLHHPHQSNWSVLGMQHSNQGSSTLGTFTIPLYPPTSDEGRRYAPEYRLIVPGMRIEGYKMVDGEFLSSTVPDFTGIVDKISESLTSFELTGFDSTWLAQTTLSWTGEFIGSSGLSASFFWTHYLALEVLEAADDFGGHGLILPGNWSSSPAGWTQTTDELLNVWQVTQSTLTPILLSNSANVPDYGEAAKFSVWAHFHITTGSANNVIADCEVLIGFDNTFQNGYICQVRLMDQGNATYNVQGVIYKDTAGTIGPAIVTSTFYTGLPLTGTQDFHCQIEIILDNRFNSNTGFSLRMVISGKDASCATGVISGQLSSGFFGIRSGQVNAANNVLNVSQIMITKRPVLENYFQTGNIVTNLTNLTLSLTDNVITYVDIWNIIATTEGAFWRKRPGNIHDFIDYDFAPTTVDTDIGRYLVNKVVIDEPLVAAMSIEANVDGLATTVRISSDPNSTNNGNITWTDLSKFFSIGVIPGNTNNTLLVSDVTAMLGVADFLSLRRAAQRSIALKATPQQSKTLTIIRDPSIADKFREFDLITLNVPTLGIYNASVLVVGYTFTENSPTQDITLDQFSFEQQFIKERRTLSNLDFLCAAYAGR